MLDSRTSIALVPNRNLLHNIKGESDIKLFAAGQNEIRVTNQSQTNLHNCSWFTRQWSGSTTKQAYPRNSGIKPLKLKHIHAFGQLAYYRINSTSKLDIRAKLGYLLHPSAECNTDILSWMLKQTNLLTPRTSDHFIKTGLKGILWTSWRMVT